jgi:hypothetical protein
MGMPDKTNKKALLVAREIARRHPLGSYKILAKLAEKFIHAGFASAPRRSDGSRLAG